MFTRDTQLTVRRRIDRSAAERLGEAESLVVYRVAQEALTNAVRHSGGSAFELALAASGGSVLLTVSDDGNGTGP